MTALADDLSAVVDQIRQSTVQVGDGGSGVIWDSDGLIMTNAHVARQKRMRVQLVDGRVLEGRLVARDQRRDLAAVRVTATGLPAIQRADSDELRPGQLVVAVGNPLGLAGAAAAGVIRARLDPNWVQADVRLAPGNSGGPLADAQGRAVGINSMIVDGIGFAVPSNAVERFARSLVA